MNVHERACMRMRACMRACMSMHEHVRDGGRRQTPRLAANPPRPAFPEQLALVQTLPHCRGGEGVSIHLDSVADHCTNVGKPLFDKVPPEKAHVTGIFPLCVL